MPDILIRDVPDDVVAAIDAKAQRAGLSRTEYLRRTLSRERTEDAEYGHLPNQLDRTFRMLPGDDAPGGEETRGQQAHDAAC